MLKIHTSSRKVTKLCDWSARSLLAVVQTPKSPENFNQGEGSTVQLLVPVDTGTKSFGQISCTRDSPYIEICEISKIKELHKYKIIWIQFNETGEFLSVIDESGYLTLFKTGTIANDFNLEHSFNSGSRVVGFSWLNGGRRWILSDRRSTVFTRKFFEYLTKDVHKGPKLKSGDAAYAVVNAEGKVFISYKNYKGIWKTDCLNLPNNMSNHNVELHLVDICLTSDEVILVSGVWYNKENLRVNLVIYKIIYNNKEDNLELFMSLSEDLDGHILNNKCSLKLNDEHRISRILLSEKGYIICIFEVEDNLKGVPAVISVWKLNQHSQPRLIYINSCSLDFSNIDHVEKFLRDDIFDAFTQSAQSGAAEFSVIISGKYMEELVIVSIPQLDCTTKSCSNSEDEDGEFTSCLEKMCIPADLCSKLENISKEGKPFSSPTLLEYRSLVISPNGIYAKKFGVFDKHTNIKSLSTEKPQMLVMIIPLLSDSKINAANVENLINYIFNILLLALTNNRDYQDVVNLIYEYEFKYPSNRILDRLIERISSIASEDFPSYSSSLSMDGKIFFLLISLCRYKYIRSCVNFDIIVQTQYLIEGCLSSFKVKNQVLNLAEKIINSNSINVEASVSGFSKFVDLKYENFPKVMLFGSWFLELCATISRSLHVLSKTVFEKKNTDSEESQHSEVETDAFPGSKKYNNMGIVAVMLSVQYLKAMILLSLIFFIARDKLDYLLSLKDINHSQNSAILNELLNSRNTFDSNKLRISKFTIFLLKVLNLINHQEITPSESLKYLHKDSPKNHPTLIPQMIKLFHEHVVEFYPSLSSPKNSFNKTESKGDGVAVTPMRVLALERQVENIFAYINADFLNLWTFYSSYPYTEIVYAKMPSLFENMLQRKEIRRGAFFDILTKRRIGSNKNILICNRCNHHSADTIKMPETNNRNLNSSKSTCICGGTWRRISLGAI